MFLTLENSTVAQMAPVSSSVYAIFHTKRARRPGKRGRQSENFNGRPRPGGAEQFTRTSLGQRAVHNKGLCYEVLWEDSVKMEARGWGGGNHW